MAEEPMVGLLVDEIAEPIIKAEEQVMALVIDMDEDIAMLFGDDDFGDDDSKGFDEEEVWEVDGEWLMAPVTPPPMPVVPPPSIYEVGGPSTPAAEEQSFLLLASGVSANITIVKLNKSFGFNSDKQGLEYGRYRLEYDILPSSGYGVSDLVSFVVFGE
ncbi:hypothetical protein Tco_0842167 [Tanacetum coccineum]|uniref:Uncharacterized protein n=1 Tax=Tanacetum coccineum TaxID=301880 RepID=A0ABQ5AZ26_9ASTR